MPNVRPSRIVSLVQFTTAHVARMAFTLSLLLEGGTTVGVAHRSLALANNIVECNGGDDYTCPFGKYKSGEPCSGTSTQDSQSCSSTYTVLLTHCFFCCTDASACNNRGSNYDCPAGKFRSGRSCDGTSDSDTQTCSSMLLPCLCLLTN